MVSKVSKVSFADNARKVKKAIKMKETIEVVCVILVGMAIGAGIAFISLAIAMLVVPGL